MLAAPATCASLLSISSPHQCSAATLSVTESGVQFAYVGSAALRVLR